MQNEPREHVDLSGLFLSYREEGNVSAFQEIMDVLYGPIFNYLLRLLRNREDAEDALQDVWLKVINQSRNYNEQGQFTSWVYRIAHNHCLDSFRRRGRKKEDTGYFDGDNAEILDRFASEENSPRDALAESERLTILEEAIGTLPEAIREVYLLRAVHDIPFKEIAEIQNAPLGTVLSRMHQAVQYLKKIILAAPSSAEELA
jgi:RNA polymerase sigma-70 factor, ECF subfamily